MSKYLEQQAVNVINSFLESEIGDISYFQANIDYEEIEYSEYQQTCSISVDIETSSEKGVLAKTLYFGVKFKDEQISKDFKKVDLEETDVDISIQIYEDAEYEETSTYNWNVKHFWQALLSWEL